MKKLFSENAEIIIQGRNGGGIQNIIELGRHDFEGLSRNGGGSVIAPRLTLGGGTN